MCVIRPDQRHHCRTAQDRKEFPPAHVRPLAQETASYQFNRVL
jgi:hypothetical protein